MGVGHPFGIDLRETFATGGSLAAAVQIVKGCFHREIAATATPADVLAELQRPDVHGLIEWRQDLVLSPPRPLVVDLTLIATENQSNWQAAQRADGSVEIGMEASNSWNTWQIVDLSDLLLRLLVMEVVVGRGPCVSSELPASVLRPFELVPRVALPQGSAELVGVVAGDRWIGVITGDEKDQWLYSFPNDRVRHDLAELTTEAAWDDLAPSS